MTRRVGLAAMIAIAAIVAWWRLAGDHAAPAPVRRAAADRAISPGLRDALARLGGSRSGRLGRIAAEADEPAEGSLAISGHVIELHGQRPVGNVEVVFRGAAGETTTTSGDDGAYTVHVAPGVYRAFVRDDAVMSFARADRVRIPGLPSASAAGMPDEGLMTIIFAQRDAAGVDLSVLGGGILAGRVVDGQGRPIAGAVVRARGGSGLRPALGTDVAESDRDGRFELRLPAGVYLVDATHAQFAGVTTTPGHGAELDLGPGTRIEKTFVLAAGCIITGRVVGADGRPAGDGAIELGAGGDAFRPVGQIEPDGTFRWATTDEYDVTLRAWPWKAPPSEARAFACHSGARFDDVVFQLADRRPELEGVLVDQAGAPVRNGYLDVMPLDEGGMGQQERSDAQGRWAVYLLPAGRYRITAQAEGRGVTSATMVSPASGQRLVLGGTGRLEGTTSRLTSGSFELVLGTCIEDGRMISLPASHRMVAVTGGRFAIEDLPACALSFAAVWRGDTIAEKVAIPSGGTAHVELDLGPPRPKIVRGVVRDVTGAPVAGAEVAVTSRSPAVTRTDASGAYTIQAFAGASLRVSARALFGSAEVSRAAGDSERLDILALDLSDDGGVIDSEDVEVDD